MKKKILLALVPLVLAVVAAVALIYLPKQKAGIEAPAQSLAGTVLKFHTWDTYIAPEIFKEFEKETGIKVEATIFDTNDTLLKELKEGKSYDLITPSGNYIWHLVQEKLLAPMPDGLRTLSDGLAEQVKNPSYDPQHKWGLPVFYGTTGIAVNTKFSPVITSWKELFERPAGEKPMIGMLDEVASVITAASFALGTSDCDASDVTLGRIKELLQKQEPFVKTYVSENYYDRLATGDVALQMAWSGDVYIARKKNNAVQYIYPAEGVDVWMDMFAIPKTSKNKDAAAQFIQFALDPKRMANYATVSGNIPAVAGAMEFLPPEMRSAPEFNVPKSVRAVTTQACPPEKSEAYAQIVEPFLTR